MLRHAVLTFAAGLALFLATQAQAIPPKDFCEENPTSPLCDPEEPPNPCMENPELCEPPDPCEIDPASCEPPDPCEIDPASCEPEPPPTSGASLSGTQRIKGHGFRKANPSGAELFFGEETFTLMEHDGCTYFTGNLAGKGKKGTKQQLFLDEASSDTLAGYVAGLAGAAAGATPGNPLGESSKIILKRHADGTASLKIKAEILFDGLGSVVLKANYTGVVIATAAPRTGERCL